MKRPPKDDIMPPLQLNIIVSHQSGSPIIELRRRVIDKTAMQHIISSAFHEQPIIIMPVFKNKMLAVNSLISKGILYNKNGKYYFNI